jgi:hypothetical protein
MSAPNWAQPATIDDVTVVFPARVVGRLLPDMEDIPAEFKHRSNPWSQLVSRWFFRGLTGRFVPRDGIDGTAALRHVKTVLGSFEPKHEHKEAGVAYLLSLWFDRYEDGPRPSLPEGERR